MDKQRPCPVKRFPNLGKNLILYSCLSCIMINAQVQNLFIKLAWRSSPKQSVYWKFRKELNSTSTSSTELLTAANFRCGVDEKGFVVASYACRSGSYNKPSINFAVLRYCASFGDFFFKPENQTEANDRNSIHGKQPSAERQP